MFLVRIDAVLGLAFALPQLITAATSLPGPFTETKDSPFRINYFMYQMSKWLLPAYKSMYASLDGLDSNRYFPFVIIYVPNILKYNSSTISYALEDKYLIFSKIWSMSTHFLYLIVSTAASTIHLSELPQFWIGGEELEAAIMICFSCCYALLASWSLQRERLVALIALNWA